ILRIVGRSLRKRTDVELVGLARDGNEALALVEQVSPEAVILDIEMPGMDGLETLARLRKTHPLLPVVMFSSLTEPGARATFDAIANGASDYVLKPSSMSEGLEATMQLLGDKIVALVRTRRRLATIYGLNEPSTPRPSPVAPDAVPAPAGPVPAPLQTHAPEPPPRPALRKRRFRPQLLLIGASTGGPQALGQLLPALPHPLPVPCLVVQHMPPMFTRQMASRLDLLCPVPVKEAAHGESLRPGEIWIAPGDYHLEVATRGAALWGRLTQDEPENSCRPAVDVLFRTGTQACGGNILGVVLTGMGRDGLLGGKAIVAAGGRVLSQDAASCVVWGMPRAIEEAGIAHAVVPLDGMAAAIREQLAELYIAPERAR
ncbi:MAG: chemotaxis-specific protein-glutamate methyltransferase CheB, partial [Myxococcota bacterium]